MAFIKKALLIISVLAIPIFLISTINENNLFLVEEMLNVARKYETTIHLRPTIYTGNARHNSLARIDPRKELEPFLKDKNVRNYSI